MSEINHVGLEHKLDIQITACWPWKVTLAEHLWVIMIKEDFDVYQNGLAHRGLAFVNLTCIWRIQ